MQTVSTPREKATSSPLKPPSDQSEPVTTPSVLFVENAGQFDSRIRFQAQARNGNFRLVDQAIWITLSDRMANALTKPRQSTRVTKGTVLTKEQFDEAQRDKKTLILQGRDDERVSVPVKPLSGVNVKLSFPGSSFSPWVGSFPLSETKFSYFLGNNKEGWRSNVPVWGTTSYKNLYSGINLITESDQGSLVLRFLRSGKNRAARDFAGRQTRDFMVKVRVQGPTAVQLIPSKIIKGLTLKLTTASGILALPIVGVTTAGANIKKVSKSTWDISLSVLSTSPTISAATGTSNAHHAGQSVEALQVLYSTYLGGVADDWANGVVLDADGNAIVTGQTASMRFPFPGTPGPFVGEGGAWDVFVVKIDPWGRRLRYATFLGGPASDLGSGVALDGEGDVIVTGTTSSGDGFPTLGPTWGPGGSADVFVTKLDQSGLSLIYSVRLGGAQDDTARRVAVDRSNNVAIVGSSNSSNFPTTPGVVATSISRGLVSSAFDAIVLKLSASGSTLLYSTFLGGTDTDRGNDLVLDDAGNAFVTGETYSYDDRSTPENEGFPVTNFAFQREGPTGAAVTYSAMFFTIVVPNSDAFVAKLTSDGSALIYSTYLGGPGADWGMGIAIIGTGKAVVTGAATEGFPTRNAYSSYRGGRISLEDVPIDAFVTVFNDSGSELEYSTFLGGWDNDAGSSIDVDTSGSVYVTGWTDSTVITRPASIFPRTRDPFRASPRTTYQDIFAAKLDPSIPGASSLLYSTFFGGLAMDLSADLSVNSGGIICIAGYTTSLDYPTRPDDVLRRTFIGGFFDGVVTKLDLRP
jgi:hypothetical protein